MTGKRFEDLGLRLDSGNFPHVDAKGLGFSSSAGAAVAMALFHATRGEKPDYTELSRVARLFAGSASRTMVGGFSRLYAGKGYEDTYAEKFADERDLPLRMVIVPLTSTVRTEDAHREVEGSPFFKARVESASKRCEEMERAIRGGDLRKVGELTEQDTLELHSITMTGTHRMVIMSPDTVRIIQRVRELRRHGGGGLLLDADRPVGLHQHEREGRGESEEGGREDGVQDCPVRRGQAGEDRQGRRQRLITAPRW